MDFKRDFSIILGVTFVFIIAFGGGLFYLKGTIGDLSGTLAVAQSTLAFQLTARQSSALLQKQFEDAQSYERALDYITPISDELAGLSRSFQLLKTDHNVEGEFNFGQDQGGSDGKLLGIHFTILGAPRNVLNFMNAIIELPYFIKMDSIDMTRDGSRWRVSARGAVFYFAE